MKKILHKLNEKNGDSSYTGTLVMLFIIFIILSIFLNFFTTYHSLKKVEKAMNNTALDIVTTNSDETYSSKRDGYSGGYLKSGSTWIEDIEVVDIAEALKIELNLNENLESEYFQLKNIQIDMRNSELTSNEIEFSANLSLNVHAKFYNPVLQRDEIIVVPINVTATKIRLY